MRRKSHVLMSKIAGEVFEISMARRLSPRHVAGAPHCRSSASRSAACQADVYLPIGRSQPRMSGMSVTVETSLFYLIFLVPKNGIVARSGFANK